MCDFNFAWCFPLLYCFKSVIKYENHSRNKQKAWKVIPSKLCSLSRRRIKVKLWPSVATKDALRVAQAKIQDDKKTDKTKNKIKPSQTSRYNFRNKIELTIYTKLRLIVFHINSQFVWRPHEDTFIMKASISICALYCSLDDARFEFLSSLAGRERAQLGSSATTLCYFASVNFEFALEQ